jgi:hypothetical protein
LFGGTPRRAFESRKPQPDFAQLHEELQRHPHLPLQLAWEKYRRAHPDGYIKCDLALNRPVLRQNHISSKQLNFSSVGYHPGRHIQPSWVVALSSRFAR